MAGNSLILALLTFATATSLAARPVQDAPKGDSAALPGRFFRVQVVDEQTGRGVPLVQLKTTNHLRYITDSNGIAAICEPGLMGREVFFEVSSHGYEYPKDGFGYRGTAVEVEPGGSATIQVKRINIAERFYRVTGQGIYRDSVLTGDPVPLEQPVLNAQVVGQDSVQNALYKGRLYWFWGDTAKPSYPLGQFATSGATSLLPGVGGLDPAVGVNLRYFTDGGGFSKKMAPLDGPGMVWLDGVFTVQDADGHTRLLAKYARMKSLGEAVERGLMVFENAANRFVPLLRGDPDVFVFRDWGHPFALEEEGREYLYFATPFPLAVRMRIERRWDHVVDPNAHQVYTSLPTRPSQQQKTDPRWISSGELLDSGWKKADLIRSLRREKNETAMLRDSESGNAVRPHAGSVFWNEYRNRWIMIAVQQGGESSYLGEVWYAEADDLSGPWLHARRIATHNKYSFYNPKHHPYFDQQGGRIIYFEGTYTFTFSGEEDQATPRYDYNQIMYRLDLADPRLELPERAARRPSDDLPPMPPGARLAFEEDWSTGRIDPAKWYPLHKRWGSGNNGVVRQNLRIARDLVQNREKNVLLCTGHGDEYDGPVVGWQGESARVGGVLVTRPFFASGRYEVVMKIGDTHKAPGGPADPTHPIGMVPAIWTYAYRWVSVDRGQADEFASANPLYNPHMNRRGWTANEYWSELDFPEFGKDQNLGVGLYNTFLNVNHQSLEFCTESAIDGRYHVFTTDWRTHLVPVEEITDDQVVEYEGFHWVADKAIPFETYRGNPLKRLGPNRYAVYAGKSATHYIDGRKVGVNTTFVPAMAAQLNVGVWFPGWGGAAPWKQSSASVASVRIWQYDDPGDVRGILIHDISSNMDEHGNPPARP